MLPTAKLASSTTASEVAGDDAPGVKSAPAHVVGPGELGIRGSEKDAAAEVGVEDDDLVKEGGGGLEDGEDGRALKRLKAGGEETEAAVAGMSIADRLEALSQEIYREGKKRDTVGAWGGGGGGGNGTLAVVGGRGAGGQPRVESLSTVLTQALQSGDNGLMEKCLGVGDQEVIEATVERLPSSKVVPFLLRWVLMWCW